MKIDVYVEEDLRGYLNAKKINLNGHAAYQVRLRQVERQAAKNQVPIWELRIRDHLTGTKLHGKILGYVNDRDSIIEYTDPHGQI